MKILYLVIICFFITSSITQSQTIDFYTAKEGYENLIISEGGPGEGYELLALQTYSVAESEMQVDFESGTATIWIYYFKEKESVDDKVNVYYLFKLGDIWAFEVEDNGSVELPLALSPNWKDSDLLADVVKKTSEIKSLRDQNLENIMFEMYTLNRNIDDSTEIWGVGVVFNDQSSAICEFRALDLSLINCETPTSVIDILSKATLIYPNPSNNFITIELPFSGEVSLKIYNTQGEEVFKLNNYTDGKIQLNTNNLPVGVYNTIISSSDGVFSKMIVINR